MEKRQLYVTTGDGFACIAPGEHAWEVALALKGLKMQCLALDPSDPRKLYVGSQGQGVWRSGDGAASWEHLSFPQPDLFSLAVSPADGTVYAGCEPSMLFRSVDEGESWVELEALREIPSAPTWRFPPRPWTSHVRWIAPNPHEAEVLLVGIELGGVMYSEDGGRTWLDHRPGAQRDAHALAWHPEAHGRAYEAAGGGAAWSRDGGKSWRPADAGRDWHYTWGLAIDPHEPDLWYVSAGPGPHEVHVKRGTARARIYRWRGDGPWAPIMNGLSDPLDSLPYALAATSGALYAGLGDGRICTSEDNGDSWRLLELRGDRLDRITALACGPEAS